MNIAIIAVAVIVVVLGVVNFRGTTINQNRPSPAATSTPSAEPPGEPSAQPVSTIAPSPTVKPTPVATDKQVDDTGWVYPGASGHGSVYTSQDSPEKITQWYTDKINSEGFNVKNFVKTSANDNVKNVISATGDGISVEIEITRAPGEEETRIEIVTSV